MPGGSPVFETTLWSQVITAGAQPDSDQGRRAAARLCEMYWYPVYACLRRKGHRPEDAEDLTQGFFQHVLEKNFFRRADRGVGRFRNFLLGALDHFCANEYTKASAQRRGGRVEKVPLDALLAENWLAAAPALANDAAAAFDHAWATALLSHSLVLIEREQDTPRKAELFAVLKTYLQRAAEPGEYEALGSRFGMKKGAVAAAVHRLNTRLGEIVRTLVRDTVVDPEAAEDEMRALFAALRG